MSNAKKIKLPYGTLADAARKLGITRQSAQQGWAEERADVVEVVAAIIEEKLNAEREKREAIKQIALNVSQL